MHSVQGSSGSQPCWHPGQTLLAQLLSSTAADTPAGWFVMQVWKQASVWQASQQSSSGTQSFSSAQSHHSLGQAVEAQLVQLSPAPGQNGPPELELATKLELDEPVELPTLEVHDPVEPPPLDEELAVQPPPLDDEVAVEPPPLDDDPTLLDTLEPLPLTPVPLAPVPLDGPAPTPTELPVAPPSPAPPKPSSKRISLPQAALSTAQSASALELCDRGAIIRP
jgi:hypothetical protein